MNKKMRAAQIGKPGRDFELAERDIPEPGAGQVRVNHEIAERVDAIGNLVLRLPAGTSEQEKAQTYGRKGIGGLGHLGVQYARQMGIRNIR